MSGVKNYFRTVATVGAALLFFSVSAQTLEEARSLYNEGGEAVQNGDLTLGVQKFVECIEMCQILVDDYEDTEAEDLMLTVQGNVPKLYYQIGMDQLKSNQVSDGLINLYKAKETAENYGDSDVEDKTVKVLPQVHYKLGASKYKNSDYEGALVEFDKALAVDPNYANAHYLKAVVFKAQEDDEKLVEASKKAIAAAELGNDSKTKTNTEKLAGGYFLKKGNDAKEASNYDEAIKNLNTSLEFEKNNSTTYFLLVSVYTAQGKWDNAISAANEGLQYESATDKPRFYYELGMAYAGKGDKAAACDAFSQAAIGDYTEHATYQMEHVVKCNE